MDINLLVSQINWSFIDINEKHMKINLVMLVLKYFTVESSNRLLAHAATVVLYKTAPTHYMIKIIWCIASSKKSR